MRGLEGSTIRGAMWLEAEGLLCGYAIDDSDLTMRLAIEILADGEPVALLRAERGLAVDLPDIGGDECFGFTVRLPGSLLAQTSRLVARLANRAEILGAVDLASNAQPDASRHQTLGVVAWTGGARLSGHVPRERDGDPVPIVRALIDGGEVARATCRAWIQLDHGEVARRFEIDLPAPYADGRVRSVEVVSSDGTPLVGSPCLAVAFPDALADWIDGWAELESEKLRARFADGLLPRSVPLSEIEGWLERFPLPRVATANGSRIAVVIVGTGDSEATLKSLGRQDGIVVRSCTLRAIGTSVTFEPQQLRDFLVIEASDCPLVVMAISGTRFALGALAWLAEAADRYPNASAVYPDLLIASSDDRRWPLAFPAFDPELFLERGYCAQVYGVRRVELLRAFDKEPSLFGYFPDFAGEPLETWPVHVPFPLATVPDPSRLNATHALASASLARLAGEGQAAEVDMQANPGLPTVRIRRLPPQTSLSVVIAVRDQPLALQRTLGSLEADSSGRETEIILVDNESSDSRTLDLLAEADMAGHRVIRVPGWFCPARLLSMGADAARGEHLLFLQAGVAGSGGWIDEMQSRLAGSGVGVVGAVVSWTSGVIRDAGYVIGPRLSLAPRFTDRMVGDSGYAGLMAAAHGVSCVSSACLMAPSALFRSLGAFDASSFPKHLYAQDFCLKVRSKGSRVVLTPHAEVTMDGSSSFGDPSAEAFRQDVEARRFRDRWAIMPGCDPFYSPWLTMDDPPFSGLAWPPGPFRPRGCEAPTFSPFPIDL
jgi:O-antigen biosynthesis protein